MRRNRHRGRDREIYFIISRPCVSIAKRRRRSFNMKMHFLLIDSIHKLLTVKISRVVLFRAHECVMQENYVMREVFFFA